MNGPLFNAFITRNIMLNRLKKQQDFVDAGRSLTFACGRIIENSMSENILFNTTEGINVNMIANFVRPRFQTEFCFEQSVCDPLHCRRETMQT